MAVAARVEGGGGGTPAYTTPSEVHFLHPLQLCLWKVQGDKAAKAAGPLTDKPTGIRHRAPTEQHWVFFPSFLGTSFNNPL